MIRDGREIRMQRLMGDGHAVIVAIDHGLFDGPIPAMENLPVTAAKISPAVDAILLAPGMLRHCSEPFGSPKRPLAVVRLNWNTGLLFFAQLHQGQERIQLRPARRVARRYGHRACVADITNR